MTHEVEHVKLLELESKVLLEIGEYANESSNAPSSLTIENKIQHSLSQIRALTRDLELILEELDGQVYSLNKYRVCRDDELKYVSQLLSNHKVEYNRIQTALKNAALERQVKSTQRMAQDRKLLLGNGQQASERRQRITTEAQLVEAAEGTTESLRRTRQMIAEEIEHTSATLAVMETSHTQLANTRNEYVGQHAILRRSRGLLRTLNWQNRSETILLWFGLLLFLLTSAYVGHKRMMFFVPEPLRPGSLIRSTARILIPHKAHNWTTSVASPPKGSGKLDASLKPSGAEGGLGTSPPHKSIDGMPESMAELTTADSAPKEYKDGGIDALVGDVRADL